MENGPEEVFVDFRGNKYGQLKIKLKNMAQYRPSKYKLLQKVSDKHMNVLNIFVDTISKERFYRKFPYTAQFLIDLKNDPKSKGEVYEFHRFHSIGGITQLNLIGSEYGMGPHRWKYRTTLHKYGTSATEKGYVWGMAGDNCEGEEGHFNMVDHKKGNDTKQFLDDNFPHHWML